MRVAAGSDPLPTVGCIGLGIMDRPMAERLLRGGFASGPILRIHGERMLKGDYTSGFRSRLHAKDARIIERIARRVGASTPAFSVAHNGLATLERTGRGELDHAALYSLVDPRPGKALEDGDRGR